MKDRITVAQQMRGGVVGQAGGYADLLRLFPARGLFRRWEAKDWVKDEKTGLLVPDYRWRWDERLKAMVVDEDSAVLIGESEQRNVVTESQVDYQLLQMYGTSGLAAVGLPYVGLSNDTVTEDANSTTLSNEIAANGLTRAIGAYAHTNGTGVATITKTFTVTGTQGVKKGALFSAGAAGTMGHVIADANGNQSLVNGNLYATTFTLTLAAA